MERLEIDFMNNKMLREKAEKKLKRKQQLRNISREETEQKNYFMNCRYTR